MEETYELLTEREEMWARMLLEVLQDHEIPVVTEPVYGAAMVLRGGVMERLRVFVPADRLPQARTLLEELFPENTQNNEEMG